MGDDISLDQRAIGETPRAQESQQGKIITASELHLLLRRLKISVILLFVLFAVVFILALIIGIFSDLQFAYVTTELDSMRALQQGSIVWTSTGMSPDPFSPSSGWVLAGMPIVVGQWTNGTTMPTPRSDLEALYVNNLIYLVGGTNRIDAVTPTLDSVDVYDPATNSWTAGIPMPTARYRFAAAVHKNSFFVIGGRRRDDDVVLGSVEEFNTLTNTWITHTNLRIPRSDMSAAVVGDTLYIMGGYDGDYDALQSTEVYDITSQVWGWGPNMTLARGDIEAVELDGRLFVAGGYGSAPDYAQLRTFETYEPSLNQWVVREPLPIGRGDAGMAVMNELVYVIGGEVAFNGLSHPVQMVDVYNPRSQEWSSRPALPIPSFRKSCTGTETAIYCFGGSTCDNAFVSGCDSAGADEQISILDTVHEFREISLSPYIYQPMPDEL